MSRTFLISDLPRSLNSANLETFGEVVTLLDRPPHIWKADRAIEAIVDALEHEQYEPASDFIVLSGAAVGLVYFGQAVAQYMLSSSDLRNDHGWTALVFNSRDTEYQPITIPLVKEPTHATRN